MKWIQKAVIVSHRYLGIALSLLVVMWFATGIVMMYAGGMPRLAPELRLERLPELDMSQVRLSLSEAAELAGFDPASGWGGGREPPGRTLQLRWEFGRKFVTPPSAAERQQQQQQQRMASPSAVPPAPQRIAPVWTVDFSTTGDGNTYNVYASRPSTMFHTYYMPVGGRVVGSWMHTHAQAASDLWVFDAPHAALLGL